LQLLAGRTPDVTHNVAHTAESFLVEESQRIDPKLMMVFAAVTL
jgi:hypothetical protein